MYKPSTSLKTCKHGCYGFRGELLTLGLKIILWKSTYKLWTASLQKSYTGLYERLLVIFGKSNKIYYQAINTYLFYLKAPKLNFSKISFKQKTYILFMFKVAILFRKMQEMD